MATSLDSAYTGIGNVQNIPAEQRIYGRTKDILRVTRGRIPMMRVMTENMGPKMAVTDMEIKYKSDYPIQALITMAAASTTTETIRSIITVPDAQAVYLREGTRLYHDRTYYNGYRFATGTGDDYLPGNIWNSQRECVVVLERLTSSGGNTTFKVQRGYKPATGATFTGAAADSAGGGTLVQFAINTKMLLGLVPQAIGDNTGGVYGDTPHEETNYCEITLEKMGVARTADRINIYQDRTILQRNSERQIDLFWKKNELKCMFGRKVDGSTNLSPIDGSYIYETGGVDEYIHTAQTGIGYTVPTNNSTLDTDGTFNIINFQQAHGAVNYQSLNEFGKNKFYYGSNTKWWICDDIQFTRISNSFDNKVRINYNASMSLKYGFKVSDLEISGGGVFHLAQSDLMSIYGVRNRGFIIDFDYFKPIHLQGEDFTIMVDVEKGLNPLKRVDYLYNNRGYLRNCPFAHYDVYNL